MSPAVSSTTSVGIVESSDDSDDEGFEPHSEMDAKPVDPFRFSQATLEDTQEDELNAILGELSALQMSLDQEIIKPTNLLQVPGSERDRENKTNGSTTSENGVRTESPDNDSGFSDNASLLSSGSSLSASGSSSGSSSSSGTSCAIKNIPASTVLHANEDEKAIKIREALAKMRAASVTRLYVKAFSTDGSSKALMVDESMSCGRVLALLADKNHVPLSPKWTLVEHLPQLHMERVYEDHENMVENLLMWTRDSKNKIYFVERDEKFDMFINPQRYFLENRMSHGTSSMDEHTKNGLIDEFFNQGIGVPDVESTLYLKAEGKKAWKKFTFVLRASGIYYYPKGRLHANSSKDLQCLATIDPNQQTYQGIGWKKKFKAPTEFGFVLKPARLQVKSHRHMKYLCAEDSETLKLWMVGLRIAKYKRQLWDNYRSLMDDIAHEDLDRFGRSISLASMPIQINTKDPDLSIKMSSNNSTNHTNNNRQNEERIYSTTNNTNNQTISIGNNMRLENSMGQVINFHPSPQTPSGTLREEGFESENPAGGTIKRKPSGALQPKIPLTIKTRSIVGEYINTSNETSESGNTNSVLTHTLQRRRSSSGSGNSSASNSSSSSLSSINSQPGTLQSQLQMQMNNMNNSLNMNGSSSNSHNNNNNSSNNNITNSSPNSVIYGQTRQMFQGKPPLSTPTRKAPPAVVEEETADSLDFENLPPPPPELLIGNSGVDVVDSSCQNESSMIINSFPCPPPPPPPSSSSSNGILNGNQGQLKNNHYHTTSSLKVNSSSNKTPGGPQTNSVGRNEKKKGVSFASELTQRLQSRNNNLNNTNGVTNNITTNSDNNGFVLNQNTSSSSSSSSLPSQQQQKSISVNNNNNNNSRKKLDDPPQEFLSEIQRVMQKKWQVAQKCQMDRNTTPHEILGFRISDLPQSPLHLQQQQQQHQLPSSPLHNNTTTTTTAMTTTTNNLPLPPPPVTNTPTNLSMTQNPNASTNGEPQITEHVRNWVSQHYGNSTDSAELTPLQIQQIPPHILNNGTSVIPPIHHHHHQQQQQIQMQQQQHLYQQPQVLPKPVPPMKPTRYESNPSMDFPLPPPPQQQQQQDMNSMGYNNHHQVQSNGGVVIYENFQGKKNSQILNHHHLNNMNGGMNQSYSVQLRNKKPPPPVPKRAESTHLSAHIVYN